MLLIQLVVATVLALGAGDAPSTASPRANQVSLEEEWSESRRPRKPEGPQPSNVTWGEIKGLYR